MQNLFTQSIETLSGVGPSLMAKFERLGLKTLEDCLFHLPYRYQDRTRVHPISALRAGDCAVIIATIVKNEIVIGKRRMLRIQVQDFTGTVYLRFFHFNARQREQLVVGATIRCFGEIRAMGYALEMIHPEYTLGEQKIVQETSDHMTPVYSLTDGLTQITLRKWISMILKKMHEWDLPDLLPKAMIEKLRLPALKSAIDFCHAPPSHVSHQALEAYHYPEQKRLAFEELLAHQISLLKYRKEQQLKKAPACPQKKNDDPVQLNLPFELTSSQKKVINEINADLNNTRPMMRLIQGDVGSGKTVVALFAMLRVASNGYQAVLMVPTEILAQQHAQYFQNHASTLGLHVTLLSGQLSAKEKKIAYEDIFSGRALLIIGTHALVQETVEFKNLGLIVIDEQHRFGVNQRLSLLKKGEKNGMIPHQIMMTATPIPRTLSMTAYADLDVSMINELPKGRRPILTLSVSQNRRDEIIERVYAVCQQGEQAYWVCTLIDESEALEAQAALELSQKLSEKMPNIRLGLIHGRLSGTEKDQIMQDFIHGNIQLLIATTVIEVGVNVPNASLMIIENPERLGLAQLHQLRGRVGRGEKQSYCTLIYNVPLSYTAKMRLKVMRETQDGFIIAEQDLKLRGPGEWLGTRQTGITHYKIADLARDQEWIPLLREAAEQIMQETPEQAESLVMRWLGNKKDYAMS